MTDDDTPIAFLQTRLVLQHGLDIDGNPVVESHWENVADPGGEVSLIEQLGMLELEKQTVTLSHLEGDD